MRIILVIGLFYVIYKFFVVPPMALNESYKREQKEKEQKTRERQDEYIDYEEVDK